MGRQPEEVKDGESEEVAGKWQRMFGRRDCRFSPGNFEGVEFRRQSQAQIPQTTLYFGCVHFLYHTCG